MLSFILFAIAFLITTGTLRLFFVHKNREELEKIHQKVKEIVFMENLTSTGELMVEIRKKGIASTWIPRYLEALVKERVIEFKNKEEFKVINKTEKLY